MILLNKSVSNCDTDVGETLDSVIDCVKFVVVDFRIMDFQFPQFSTDPKSHGQVVCISNGHPKHVPTEIDATLFHLMSTL